MKQSMQIRLKHAVLVLRAFVTCVGLGALVLRRGQAGQVSLQGRLAIPAEKTESVEEAQQQ